MCSSYRHKIRYQLLVYLTLKTGAVFLIYMRKKELTRYLQYHIHYMQFNMSFFFTKNSWGIAILQSITSLTSFFGNFNLFSSGITNTNSSVLSYSDNIELKASVPTGLTQQSCSALL